MTKRLMMILAVAAFAFTATAGLTACNTVSGFGQDVENTGEAIEDAGDKNY